MNVVVSLACTECNAGWQAEFPAGDAETTQQCKRCGKNARVTDRYASVALRSARKVA